ncbi:ABC transporter permease [Amycolatopsis sp. NPDC003676]
MLVLVLRGLRKRIGGFVATFVALLFGTTIVVACAGLMESGIQTAVPPRRLAQASVVLAGSQTFPLPQEDPAAQRDPDEALQTVKATLPERVRLDAGLVHRVLQVPGVTGAVGDLSFAATMLPTGEAATGHGWASAALGPYSLAEGSAPGSDGVVLDRTLAGRAGLHVGDRLDLGIRGAVHQFQVAGIAAPDAGSPLREAALFFLDSEAGQLSGHAGKVDDIAVRTAPGVPAGETAAKITAALNVPFMTALTGDDRGLAEFPEAEGRSSDVITLSAVSGGMATAVAVFVVASTLMLSIQQRGRELALLRAIGATPGQTRRMVVGETTIIAVLAAVLAIVPGMLFGSWLFGRLSEHGVVPEAMAYRQSWVSILAGAGAILLAALLAAWIAGRRAARTRPIEALGEAEIPRTWFTPARAILAVLCFGGGIALFIVTIAVMTGPVAASTAGPSVLLWAIGLAMISPAATRAAAAVLQWPIRWLSGAAGKFAVLNARARVVPVAAAVTPIMLAVGVTTANLYLQTTQDAVAGQAAAASLRADAVVNSSPSGVPPGLAARLQVLPGVSGVAETAHSRVFVVAPYERTQDIFGFPALGVTGRGAAATTAIALSAGTLADLTGSAVVLPSDSAGLLHRGIGDTITLRMGDGETEDVRVVGLSSPNPGAEQFLLPVELLAKHTTGGVVTSILVRAAPGTDPARLTSVLDAAVRTEPAVRVSDRATTAAAQSESRKTGAWVNYLMSGMITTYTAISVVNTLVMATARRRREFGLQRLTGATRAQVLRMMGVEGLLVALIGIVLGTLVAAVAIMPFTLVAGDSILPSGPPWIYLTIIGAAALLALIATLSPAWSATRSRPVNAAQDLS